MKLYTIQDTIDYNKLTLANPSRMQGGNSYYSKIEYEGKHGLMLQFPPCKSKNGIIETNKTAYIDILFSINDIEQINWLMNFEKSLKEKILLKTSAWFQNGMDLEDIDYFFNSPIKPYKGNNYLFRVYISLNQRNALKRQTVLKVFDEDEQEKEPSDIENNDFIPIIHIKGIKFTSSSFHLDVEMRQAMIIQSSSQDVDTFDTCVIRKDVFQEQKKETIDVVLEENLAELDGNGDGDGEGEGDGDGDGNENGYRDKKIDEDTQEQDCVKNERTLEESIKDTKDTKDIIPIREDKYKISEPQPEIKTEQKLQPQLQSNTDTGDFDELEEVNIDLDNTKAELKLPSQIEIYKGIYKEALRRAKLAKKTAIVAYLEAKNIKNTYLLDEVDTSEDEDDDFLTSEQESDDETNSLGNVSDFTELSELSGLSETEKEEDDENMYVQQ